MGTMPRSSVFLITSVFCSLAVAAIPVLVFALEPNFDTKLSRNNEVLFQNEQGAFRAGHFIRSQDDHLYLRTFDSGKGRFQEETIDLSTLSELRRVDRHRSAAYPILGGIVLGGLGAVLGYSLGDENAGGGGDVEGIDERGLAALVLGLSGFSIGFVGGAIIAPETRTETAVWTRN